MAYLLNISYAIQKAAAICKKYKNILVSVSGGADSDIMLDLILKVTDKAKCKFVFFDTGIEYQVTKEHLYELEKKYNIQIERVKASVPVPLGCKKYGLPFLSKFISQMIERLQKDNFDFTNEGKQTYEELILKYPDMKGALTWWCNKYPARDGQNSKFNISNNKYLKEFMIENPPDFKISAKCCDGAKKNTSHEYEKTCKCDLKCLGLRKMEGGIRSAKYKSCYDYDSKKSIQQFRPIWHFTDEDKQTYCNLYGVQNSRCYTEYGFKRTGCAGCPFNSKFEEDLNIVQKHEPMLYLACNNIFGKSYEYIRAYRKFKKLKQRNGQLSMFD